MTGTPARMIARARSTERAAALELDDFAPGLLDVPVAVSIACSLERS